MDKPDQRPATASEERPESDLADRLARYRRRVEAEGRPRSVRLIDQAIAEAADAAKAPQRRR